MTVPTEITAEMTLPVRKLCRAWLSAQQVADENLGLIATYFQLDADRRHEVYAAAWHAMIVSRVAKQTGAPLEWAEAFLG